MRTTERNITIALCTSVHVSTEHCDVYCCLFESAKMLVCDWLMGLFHNLGDGRRHTVRAFAPWRSHRRGEISMTAISCPGDTHRHLVTRINLWRQPLAMGVAIWRQASQRRDGRENLITFCCPMLYLCCPRDGYRDVISAGLSHFGDPRRRSATAVAIPRQLSRYGEAPSCAMQAIAAHLAVPRPSRNRDFGRDTVAKVVQQAHYWWSTGTW